MPTDILQDLWQDDMEDADLLFIIQTHYLSARSTSENDVIYPDRDAYALKVRCKNGRIIGIETGPAFSESEVDVLKEKIRTQLLESPGQGVEACILFSSSPVKGFFCSTSSPIRILPPPENAPKPPHAVGDHPFILEFATKQSHDGFITLRRRNRAMTEWAWTLNALLIPTIKSLGPRLQHLWVSLSR